MGPHRELSVMIRHSIGSGSMSAKASGHLSLVLTRLLAVCLTVVGMALAGLGQTPPSKMEALVIVARPNGFDPLLLEQKPGNVLVIVDNRSGSAQLTMHLIDASGRPVHNFSVFSGRHHWHELLSLGAGTYKLVEDGHNNWLCTITIR